MKTLPLIIHILLHFLIIICNHFIRNIVFQCVALLCLGSTFLSTSALIRRAVTQPFISDNLSSHSIFPGSQKLIPTYGSASHDLSETLYHETAGFIPSSPHYITSPLEFITNLCFLFPLPKGSNSELLFF